MFRGVVCHAPQRQRERRLWRPLSAVSGDCSRRETLIPAICCARGTMLWSRALRKKNQGEETRETLILSVQAVADSIGVRMNKESVGDIHRVGRRRDGKPRPVVIHTNRWNKTALMANKKKLRENGAIKDDAQFCERVSLYEDLTKARRSIFKAVKARKVTMWLFASLRMARLSQR